MPDLTNPSPILDTEWEEVTGPWLIATYRESTTSRARLVEIGYKDEEWAEKMRKQSNRSGSTIRSGPFIGWDGEGVTIKGRHYYVMLCNSEGASIMAKNGIPTMKALNFLVDAAIKAGACNHVMFGGSYDANKILCDLSFYQAQELAQTGQVQYGYFRISYRPRKYLQITRYGDYRHTKRNKQGTITLWDAIGFFQMSFVRALEEWKIGTDDFDFISRMKAGRSDFKWAERQRIKTYCMAECKQLVAMMDRLRNQCRALDLIPERWDGAGALAQKMLKKYGIHKHMAKCPKEVNRAAQYAYFGGRIEMVSYGNREDSVWSHDIVSAYPAAMRDLPCLAHGRWTYYDDRTEYSGRNVSAATPFTLVHLRYTSGDIARKLHPFPWRSGASKSVYFPPTTEGWYWYPEVKAALDLCEPGEVEILEWWEYQQQCTHEPFLFINEVFAHRKRLKKMGSLAQIVLKLAMNAIYGKLAQRVGGKDGKGPRCHQLEWAGWITSYTRAKMYRLAMRDPQSVISFETDGLYATKCLTLTNMDENRKIIGDKVNTGSLGTWEVTQHEGIVYVQSGVYWTHDACEKCSEHCATECDHKGCDGWHPKYRGMDKGTLSRRIVLSAWRDNPHGTIQVESTRFRGINGSSVSPEQFANWGQWITAPRELSLFPKGKRIPTIHSTIPKTSLRRLFKPELELVSTTATGGGSMSAVHALPWIDGPGACKIEDELYWERVVFDEDFTTC